jgi:hypothetical protein
MAGICRCGEEGFRSMPRPRKYPPEFLDRGARLVFEAKQVIEPIGSA